MPRRLLSVASPFWPIELSLVGPGWDGEWLPLWDTSHLST